MARRRPAVRARLGPFFASIGSPSGRPFERRRSRSQARRRRARVRPSRRAIGVGATTRIGYWLWYAIPVGCFASGSRSFGAALFAAYAATRATLPVVLAVVGNQLEHHGRPRVLHRLQESLALLKPRFVLMCSWLLLALATGYLFS